MSQTYPEMCYLTRRIIELVMPNLKNKALLEDFLIKVGTSAKIPKQRGEKVTALIETGEEDKKVVFDFAPYDFVTVTPYRVHKEYPFDNEVIREDMTPIVDVGMKQAAKEMIETIDSDIEAAFNGQFPKRPNKNKKYGYLVVKRPLNVELFNDVIKDKTTLCVSTRYCPVAFPKGIKKI